MGIELEMVYELSYGADDDADTGFRHVAKNINEPIPTCIRAGSH